MKPFRFKQFQIHHDACAMKVGTDGVLIGAWADVETAENILDIGTGTGLIAIIAAQRNPHAMITGIDIDEAAYAQALKNVAICPWKQRIIIRNNSLQNFISEENEKLYQVLISNPPYFNAGVAAPNQKRQIARHSEQLSHIELLQGVNHLLAKNGVFSLILPTKEGEDFQTLAKQQGLYCTRITTVKSKQEKPVERLLMEFRRQPQAMQKEELVIQYEGRNNWTPAYIELTKAFYITMPD